MHIDRGASALYFLDGGGNVVELIANDRLDNNSDAPFGPDSLLEIAEIGAATVDTEATSAAMQEALSAEILWGGREGWLLANWQRTAAKSATPICASRRALLRSAATGRSPARRKGSLPFRQLQASRTRNAGP